MGWDAPVRFGADRQLSGAPGGAAPSAFARGRLRQAARATAMAALAAIFRRACRPFASRSKIAAGPPRSEERRVGEECVSRCRARWSTYLLKTQHRTSIT